MHSIRSKKDAKKETLTPSFAQRGIAQSCTIAKYTMPETGLDADVAYRLVHDELNLDANPNLNLATFVTSWMEPQAEKLMADSFAKNLIDQDEYPQTHAVESRVVHMVAQLVNAPHSGNAFGTTTAGSSEAIMLGLLAHKRTWQKKQPNGGRGFIPNLVMGADVHTCLEKFAQYFDVEARIAPLSPNNYVLSAQDVVSRVDANTIAVVGLAGTTFTGQMDDLVGINAALQQIYKEKGWYVPLHIDAASGGFILPFSEPELIWDFRLPHVHSINLSNHKFGLTYPGLGTLIMRDRTDVPDDLIFHINYLGGNMPNYSLNFTRSSGQVVAQYYNFLRFGRQGYTRLVKTVLANARHLAQGMAATGRFTVIGDGSRFPVITVTARDPNHLSVYAVSDALRRFGWVVPAYSLPANAQDVHILRLVVRENFSRDMVDNFLTHVGVVLKQEQEKLSTAWSPSASHPVC